jgi:hypothetical protein
MSSAEEAAAAVQRALQTCVGPGAAAQIALAQVRLAWAEAVASAGLDRGGLTSRVVGVTNGTARVETPEPILAQELSLRAEAFVHALNGRMQGRPGATLRIERLTVSVARSGFGRGL